MKIKSVEVNNRRKAIEIETAKGTFALPFTRLETKPTPKNKISQVYVDSELGKEAVTYVLDSGAEASVHLDAFLDYNKDPQFLRDSVLHKLTTEATKRFKKSGLSKHELIRRLETSPSQLYRLLDPSNYKKSIDEMIRLLSVLGCRVDVKILEDVA